MPTNVIGVYPVMGRTRTGLFSLDIAASQKGMLGIPQRTLIELYGHPNVGKSSLSYYLAATVTGKGNVAVCDLEFLDRDYLKTVFDNAGFDGTVEIMDVMDEKGKPIPDEKKLQAMRNKLYEEETGACIIDSVGAIQSIAEAEGDFGEAFMGKRAKLVAQVARSLSMVLKIKERPANAFVINHAHGIMGGRGHTTAGGDTLKYIAAVRIMMWTEKVWKESDEEDADILGFQVRGQIEKLRYGGRGRKFGFYIVPGYGVHVGASALFDCIEYGLADAGTTVKMDGKSLGYIRKDLLSYAAEGKTRKFTPFIEKLAEYETQMRKELDNERKEEDGEEDKKANTKKHK